MREEAEEICWGEDETRVDFGCLYENRGKLLRLAYERYTPDAQYRSFVLENQDWLEDYALFMALKEHFRGKPWQSWSICLMMRFPGVLETYREELRDNISFHYFLQFVFFQQWKALRSYANEKGIRIVGDVPIYVPLDSADVWANPQLFQLDPSCRPKMVAGCPPDSFSADGQLWGNPLYDWEKMKQTGYDWWIRRLKAAARMYDVVRLDHFRGFESYWSIPALDKTAINGSWQPGPGMDFINAVRKALPDLDFIAEDLGYVTSEVRKLQEDSGYPGMKVLEFAFDADSNNEYLPHTYKKNTVCYTGTHDNMPLKQWFEQSCEKTVTFAKKYVAEQDPIWGMIRLCLSSVSELAVVQMQDYLGLGADARMNFPGTRSGDNWTWRAGKNYLNDTLAARIKELTGTYGRLAEDTRNGD